MAWVLPHRLARIEFRRLRISDVRDFLAYRSDPLVARFQGWSPMSEAQARDFITSQSTFNGLAPGVWSQLGIAAIPGDGLIGDAGLWMSGDSTEAEFGISLARAVQRRGLGSEAAVGLLQLLFLSTSVSGIVAYTDVRNEPCIRALERAGMTRTGTRTRTYKGEVCREYGFRAARVGC